jgi:peptidyl-prolyl cis-trans isomerase SurA
MLTFAQQKVVADKIIAIVGDKPILRSEITNAIADERRRNTPNLPPDAELKCIILQQIMAQKALTLQAEKDSLVVSDGELDAMLENQIRGFIQAYGSKEAVEEIAGKSLFQIKEDYRQSFKERKLADMMKNKIDDEIKISPTEVKAYFDKIPKDSLAFYESEVGIGEIVIYPKASRDLEKYAMDELNDFKKQVESGQQKFETLARLYTDDPGSKETGGQYSINRTEKTWDPAFISNAFRLKDGQVSPVFKSKFGYHIIQMVNRSGDDAVVRHILRIPKITDDEINEGINKLDSVRAKLIAGTLNFGEAVAKYSDDENAKFTGGARTIDKLDKDIVLMLKDDKIKVGEYSKPVVFTDERQKKGIRIVYLKSRTEPHRENLKDDYNKVASRAIEEKRGEALERWFTTRIPNYYIMVDDELKGCAQLDPWLKSAATARQ